MAPSPIQCLLQRMLFALSRKLDPLAFQSPLANALDSASTHVVLWACLLLMMISCKIHLHKGLLSLFLDARRNTCASPLPKSLIWDIERCQGDDAEGEGGEVIHVCFEFHIWLESWQDECIILIVATSLTTSAFGYPLPPPPVDVI